MYTMHDTNWIVKTTFVCISSFVLPFFEYINKKDHCD